MDTDARAARFFADEVEIRAGLAGLDPSFRLVATIHHRDNRYRLSSNRLADYLIPKRAADADAGRIRSTGRGIAHTKTAFAYLFQLN